jgi:hypothetical protein
MSRCKYLLLVVLGLWLGTTSVSARKSDPYKPKWVTHKLPESKSNTYFFINAYGEGTSLDAARQKALANLTTRLEMERGLVIRSVLSSKTTERFSSVERENYYSETNDLDMVIEEHGKQVNIVCRVIDEYWESSYSGYRIHVLYTVAEKNTMGSHNDEITVTAKYGAAGLLSVVPSVGQFYKGSPAKGTAILAGEVASVAGILLCENTRASYEKMMIEQPKYAKEYNYRMDTWETARNLCIGAAGAIYIVNLIDALATKGAKRVKVKSKGPSFSMSPYADANSAGVGMAWTF